MSAARHARKRGVGQAAAALLVCAAALDVQAAEANPGKAKQDEPRTVRTESPPLSAEDAALVKEMTLLEHVELLRNLELFERGAEEEASTAGASRPEGG